MTNTSITSKNTEAYNTEAHSSGINNVFNKQRAHQWSVKRSSVETRTEKLQQLKAAIQENESAIKDALYSDLGKSPDNAMIEVNACYAEIDDAIENLATWMSPIDVKTSAAFADASAQIIYEARGVVLLFGPWNFPFSLVFQPLVSIIAAGNCAMVKPNEISSATSKVIAHIIESTFDPQDVAVFEGDVELANRLLELPVDHIFFTGSPAVGKLVMSAAARHLASVTLELGGKNPVVIDREANIQEAAGKIAYFRNVNSGQVCLCPENVWVHEDKKEEFVATVAATYQALFYQDGNLNPDACGKIIDDRNLNRVKAYIDDAAEKGAEIICGGEIIEATRSVHPTVLCNIPDDARILNEEVFGPLLCVFTYKNIDEVYDTLHQQPKPLALYIFSQNQAFVDDVLANTTSGGVTVNNCLLHCGEPNLPFGGVNGSGTGRYHSVHGFKELSHERAILHTK